MKIDGRLMEKPPASMKGRIYLPFKVYNNVRVIINNSPDQPSGLFDAR